MVEDYGISLLQMMENAGRGLAHLARGRFLDGDPRGRRVLVLAGTGGNGGGGLVCARRLHMWGADVRIWLTSEASDLAKVPGHQLAILERLGVQVQVAHGAVKLPPADLIVDALIGYSLRGAPRDSAAVLVSVANRHPAPTLALGRLARTFDEMIARLDEAFRRQREFTADASHELRTPLTIIKGQIDVSLQREREPEVYRQVLSTVNEEVNRLIRLAGSLLTLTRADAGQIPLTLEPVSVSDLVAGTLEQVRPLASQREIELQLLADTDVTIRADEDLLLQLLLNLLDNAIKYTPAGGQVTAGWSLDGDQVALWVRDTGPGIPEEHLSHLFDRFYRVDKSRSRAEGGVGLGLAISRWIAEAHAGSLSVESEQGAGSTFTVRLWTARSLRSLLPRSRTS